MSEMMEGLGISIAFALTPTAGNKLYPKKITPFGLEMGSKIDTTKVSNTAWETGSPPTLKKGATVKVLANWDTGAMSVQIGTMFGKNQLITITYPDTHTLAFYGYIAKFQPSEFEPGAQPSVDIEIEVTNKHSSTGAETAPAYT